MPAITVDDITTLQRLPQVDRPPRSDASVRVTTAPGGFEGEGFPVRRAFAGVDLAELDPFIHMDQMGEVEYAPGEPKGTPWHPHRGFETVTYIIDGIFEHQDSNGGGGVITNGDTQWMTAGAGILHIEKPPEHLVVSGGLFHGLQLWVNLPKAEKWAAPRYQDLRGNEVVLLASLGRRRARPRDRRRPRRPRGSRRHVHPDDDGPRDARPRRDARGPWNPDFNALAYVLAGAGTVGAERIAVATGQLAVFGPGDAISVRAAEIQESSLARARGAAPGRPADPRARRLDGPVRDEHAGRAAPGVRGLPGRQARQHPRGPQRARRRSWSRSRRTGRGHRGEMSIPRPPFVVGMGEDHACPAREEAPMSGRAKTQVQHRDQPDAGRGVRVSCRGLRSTGWSPKAYRVEGIDGPVQLGRRSHRTDGCRRTRTIATRSR